MTAKSNPMLDVIANVVRVGEAPLITYRLVTGGWIRALIAKWFIKPDSVAVTCSVCNYRNKPEHVEFELWTRNLDEIAVRLSKEDACRLARRILRDQDAQAKQG